MSPRALRILNTAALYVAAWAIVWVALVITD
jgi:hypothetical protein